MCICSTFVMHHGFTPKENTVHSFFRSVNSSWSTSDNKFNFPNQISTSKKGNWNYKRHVYNFSLLQFSLWNLCETLEKSPSQNLSWSLQFPLDWYGQRSWDFPIFQNHCLIPEEMHLRRFLWLNTPTKISFWFLFSSFFCFFFCLVLFFYDKGIGVVSHRHENKTSEGTLQIWVLPVCMAHLMKSGASFSRSQPWRAACIHGIWKILFS